MKFRVRWHWNWPFWHLAFGIWHLAFSIWHLAFGIWQWHLALVPVLLYTCPSEDAVLWYDRDHNNVPHRSQHRHRHPALTLDLQITGITTQHGVF